MIKIIAAVSINNVIGKDNEIPFDYPEDLKHFKQKTLNSTIIMGRKTFEGLKHPLPLRKNIVISSKKIKSSNVITYKNLPDALKDNKNDNIWLIGGARIYYEGLQYADEIHLTLTPNIIEGDYNSLIKFPFINPRHFKITFFNNLVSSSNELKYCIYKVREDFNRNIF